MCSSCSICSTVLPPTSSYVFLMYDADSLPFVSALLPIGPEPVPKRRFGSKCLCYHEPKLDEAARNKFQALPIRTGPSHRPITVLLTDSAQGPPPVAFSHARDAKLNWEEKRGSDCPCFPVGCTRLARCRPAAAPAPGIAHDGFQGANGGPGFAHAAGGIYARGRFAAGIDTNRGCRHRKRPVRWRGARIPDAFCAAGYLAVGPALAWARADHGFRPLRFDGESAMGTSGLREFAGKRGYHAEPRRRMGSESGPELWSYADPAP
jgi:hypothetical protein